MIKIRKSVFETNSSSTHTITIYTDDEWAKLSDMRNDPNCLYQVYRGKYVTIQDIIKMWEESDYSYEKRASEKLKKFIGDRELKDCLEEEYDRQSGGTLEDYLHDMGFNSINYGEDDCLEEEITEYTTPKGENLHIVCHYGYEG